MPPVTHITFARITRPGGTLAHLNVLDLRVRLINRETGAEATLVYDHLGGQGLDLPIPWCQNADDFPVRNLTLEFSQDSKPHQRGTLSLFQRDGRVLRGSSFGNAVLTGPDPDGGPDKMLSISSQIIQLDPDPVSPFVSPIELVTLGP